MASAGGWCPASSIPVASSFLRRHPAPSSNIVDAVRAEKRSATSLSFRCFSLRTSGPRHVRVPPHLLGQTASRHGNVLLGRDNGHGDAVDRALAKAFEIEQFGVRTYIFIEQESNGKKIRGWIKHLDTIALEL